MEQPGSVNSQKMVQLKDTEGKQPMMLDTGTNSLCTAAAGLAQNQ